MGFYLSINIISPDYNEMQKTCNQINKLFSRTLAQAASARGDAENAEKTNSIKSYF
jgi:hypothetical protein